MTTAVPSSDPSAMRTDPVATLADDLEKVLSVVGTAHRLLADRQAVDLTGLDVQVTDVCARIRALPTAQAGHFAPALDRLVESLDALETASRQFMEARVWVMQGAETISPMRQRSNAPPAGVVATAYANAARPPSPVMPETASGGHPPTGAGDGNGAADIGSDAGAAPDQPEPPGTS